MENSTATTTVFVVDDHAIVRKGLSALINQEPDMCVCAEAGSVTDAIVGIDQHEPDIIIMDITLGDSTGLDLIKKLSTRHRQIPILVLSMHEETLYMERALAAGAKGYVTKDEVTDELLVAIRHIMSGETYLSDKVAMKTSGRMVMDSDGNLVSRIQTLTDRELEVFELVGNGYGTSEIANQLSLSAKTIGTHKEHIKLKLMLAGSDELLRYAINWRYAK